MNYGPMNNDMVFKSARMVLGDEVVEGTLAVAGGHIAAIATGGSAVASAEDIGGDFLVPGLVELHTTTSSATRCRGRRCAGRRCRRCWRTTPNSPPPASPRSMTPSAWAVSLMMAAFRLVDDAGFTIPQALSTVTRNPARSVGLADRGEITPGKRADLVQVRLVDGQGGRRQPVVRAVWRAGRRIV